LIPQSIALIFMRRQYLVTKLCKERKFEVKWSFASGMLAIFWAEDRTRKDGTIKKAVMVRETHAPPSFILFWSKVASQSSVGAEKGGLLY
jgi:hypothetical protein